MIQENRFLEKRNSVCRGLVAEGSLACYGRENPLFSFCLMLVNTCRASTAIHTLNSWSCILFLIKSWRNKKRILKTSITIAMDLPAYTLPSPLSCVSGVSDLSKGSSACAQDPVVCFLWPAHPLFHLRSTLTLALSVVLFCFVLFCFLSARSFPSTYQPVVSSICRGKTVFWCHSSPVTPHMSLSV